MTPRDYYAAAALVGLLADPDNTNDDPFTGALNIADLMATEACKRWGHYTTQPDDGTPSAECARCGVELMPDDEKGEAAP